MLDSMQQLYITHTWRKNLNVIELRLCNTFSNINTLAFNPQELCKTFTRPMQHKQCQNNSCNTNWKNNSCFVKCLQNTNIWGNFGLQIKLREGIDKNLNMIWYCILHFFFHFHCVNPLLFQETHINCVNCKVTL
jgi:hypothetical protein